MSSFVSSWHQRMNNLSDGIINLPLQMPEIPTKILQHELLPSVKKINGSKKRMVKLMEGALIPPQQMFKTLTKILPREMFPKIKKESNWILMRAFVVSGHKIEVTEEIIMLPPQMSETITKILQHQHF